MTGKQQAEAFGGPDTGQLRLRREINSREVCSRALSSWGTISRAALPSIAIEVLSFNSSTFPALCWREQVIIVARDPRWSGVHLMARGVAAPSGRVL